MSDLARNKTIARGFFDCLTRGDVDGLMALFADSYTCWTAGSLPFSGTHPRAVVPAMVAGVRGVFPKGLEFTVRTMTAEEDRVSVEAESRGAHVSGQVYHQRYHYLFVIRDGKIHEAKEYFDTMHANQVLCSAPAPGFNQ
jgi:ketosteroid isomerase-like protein